MIILSICVTESFAQKAGDDQPIELNLLIHGGGSTPERISKTFFELAGGEDAKLVVIPTATSDRNVPTLEALKKTWSKRGFKNVEMLHTRDRAQANNDEFIKPLHQATAVWISGGAQSKLADAYSGTKTEAMLVSMAKKGVVIGGSSAGAAIQSKVMIQSGKEQPVIGQGFDLLPNAIIDQHFLKRSRLNRLIEAVRQHPERRGFGIDEGTSLVLNGDSARVIGLSFVIVVRVVDGKLNVMSFAPGSRFSFETLKPLKDESDQRRD
ncbi:MAG: cyanophycinase [Planctomycetota bacterium]